MPETEKLFLLGDHLPDLAAALGRWLRHYGHHELAVTIADVPILAPCGCYEDHCGSIVTGPYNPMWDERRTDIDEIYFDAEAFDGLICVELLDGAVTYIEILNNIAVRDRLRALFPALPHWNP